MIPKFQFRSLKETNSKEVVNNTSEPKKSDESASSFSILVERAKGAWEVAVRLIGVSEWLIALLIMAIFFAFLAYTFKDAISTIILNFS